MPLYIWNQIHKSKLQYKYYLKKANILIFHFLIKNVNVNEFYGSKIDCFIEFYCNSQLAITNLDFKNYLLRNGII